MALRLRRGTNAERLLITPVEGELIYTTDTKLLYVGDGSTAGGTLVTGAGGGGSTTLDALTDTDLTGVTDNQVLTWIAGNNQWEPTTLPGVGALALNELSDVDTTGLASNDVIMYDGLNFVAKSVNEVVATVGSLDVNIIGTVTGSVTGTLDGDVTGSVFGDDSTTIVDSINNTLNTTSLTLNGNNISYSGFGTDSIIISNDNRTPLIIKGVTDGGLGGFPYVDYQSVKGSIEDPQTLVAGDIVGGWKITGLDGSSGDSKVSSLWVSQFTSDANLTDAYPKSKTQLIISKGGMTYNTFEFGSEGEFKAPGAITPGVYADSAARDAGITTPAAGMMVFVTDVAKFQGYNGSAWIDLN